MLAERLCCLAGPLLLDCGPRELSNVVLTLASLPPDDGLTPFLDKLVLVAQPLLPQFQPQVGGGGAPVGCHFF